jgi:uncharacterized membrane protein (DUF441 family)
MFYILFFIINMVSVLRVQSVVLVAALLAIGIMQAIAANKLQDSSHTDTYQQVKRNAIVAISSAVVLMFLSGIVIYRQKEAPTMLDQTIILVASAILGYVGVNAADAAIDLQCNKDDNENINQAWYFSTISAAVGLVAVFLVILIKLFLKRSDIKRKLCKNCPPCPAVSKKVADAAEVLRKDLKKQGLFQSMKKQAVEKKPEIPYLYDSQLK